MKFNDAKMEFLLIEQALKHVMARIYQFEMLGHTPEQVAEIKSQKPLACPLYEKVLDECAGIAHAVEPLRSLE
jgi:hypothetical protein